MKYKVVCTTLQENIDDPWIFEYQTIFGADDAVQKWCETYEANGNCVDGWPNDYEFDVIDENGEVEKLTVSVEFEPQYYVWAKS